jgi:hypothetical protein
MIKKPYFINFQTFAAVGKVAASADGTSAALDLKLGNKFVNLAKIYKYFNVPNALCITSHFLYEALTQQEELFRFIKNYFSELQSTFGCFLMESIKELDTYTDTFILPQCFADQMEATLRETFPCFQRLSFAIRSSAEHEDSQNTSFAGIYDSFLNVTGLENIIQAVVRVWKSYYNYSAIVARIRTDNYDPFPKINVIIQQMVASRISGVAFSIHPGSTDTGKDMDQPLIEWVEGNGEKLVSGKEEVNLFNPTDKNNNMAPHLIRKLVHVYETTNKLKEFFNYHIDVEWAWDEKQLYILQVRPITTLKHNNNVKEPFINIYNLYLDNLLKGNENLGKCEDIYRLYVKKRSPAYLLASQSHISTGLSLFLQFNNTGLVEKFSQLENKLNQSEIEKIIIDIDHSIRQTIIAKHELQEYLLDTFKNTDPGENHTMIIRDFVSGEYGFISQRLPGNRLLIEASSQGLMAINRGLANCSEILCEFDEKGNIVSVQPGDTVTTAPNLREHFTNHNIQKISTFTVVMNRTFTNVKLEWVLREKEPYFIDFSTESGCWDYRGENPEHRRIIYKGIARGPVFILDSKENLSRLSISPGVSVSRIDDMLKSNEELYKLIRTIKNMDQKPVIVSKRPYAVLSYLLDDVAAFIFEGGSLLCHLSILIREAKVPSLICRDINDILENKKNVIIHHETIIGGD